MIRMNGSNWTIGRFLPFYGPATFLLAFAAAGMWLFRTDLDAEPAVSEAVQSAPIPAPTAAPDLPRRDVQTSVETDSEPEEETPADSEPAWLKGDFSGKTPFYYKLMDLEIEAAVVHQIIDLLAPVYDFRKSRPEHEWHLGLKDGRPVRFWLYVSPAEIYDIFALDSAEPVLKTRDIKVFTESVVIRGEIRDSLFQSLSHTEDSAYLATKLANEIFAWDLDFYKDPRAGDRIEVLVEKRFILGDEGSVFNGYGNILAARYLSRKETFTALRFEHEGEAGYYNPEGKSLIRDVLRSPIKLQRITSRFQRNRFHPVLKKYRPHNGIDYGAAKNTPVMAVASGKVMRAGPYGGAGIAVEILHNKEILTQYFHLNRIAAGIRSGVRVSQGQTIGFVGKTGLATSHHLHFGMKIHGKYVDPLRQKFQPGKPIENAEREEFAQRSAEYLSMLEADIVTEEWQPIVRIPVFFE